jgi:hypothetical protein
VTLRVSALEHSPADRPRGAVRRPFPPETLNRRWPRLTPGLLCPQLLDVGGSAKHKHGRIVLMRALVGWQRVRALVSQEARYEGRERRAYLRPVDPATLDVASLPFVDTIVHVRNVGIADTGSSFAGQCLYRIVAEGQVAHRVHPQCQFDFLD